jgi:monovalent cation:proton antiporter-2 (CPA2) family protein
VTETVLFQAFIYLLAAVIAVPIAKRVGLGSVLGFLLAGVLIGPSVLNLVGSAERVLKFSEFGVVMMLFLIGLELRPTLLWRLRVPIVGMGGLQVTVVAAAVFVIGCLLGQDWKIALTIGLILAMSSTAIVLQSLAERGQLKLSAGQSCFAVLLFQDIAVIPILAVLPLLGSGAVVESHGMIAHLPGWQRALATLSAVVLLVVAGRFLLRPAFRYVASSRLREIFTELALVLVIGVALLMEAVGLSAALGAFVAGVMLADSEYRHEIEADIEPFKGILLGVFFTAVGAQLDWRLVAAHPALIGGVVVGLMLVKFGIQFGLGRLFKLPGSQAMLFGLALAQGGEFCFVLISFATKAEVFPAVVDGQISIAQVLNASVAVSMALTPLLFALNDRLLASSCSKHNATNEREADVIPDEGNAVILAGFGRFGHIVGRLLRANGIGCTVLENDAEQIELLAQFGMQSYYGDATRAELLHAAGAAKAKLFISTLADVEKSLQVIAMVRREFPHLHIFARAISRQHAYDLLRAGVEHVFRDTFASSLDLSVAAMRDLGFRAVQALRAARIFKEYDEASLRDLAKYSHDEKGHISRARQHIDNLTRVLQADRLRGIVDKDDAWEIGLPRPEENGGALDRPGGNGAVEAEEKAADE